MDDQGSARRQAVSCPAAKSKSQCRKNRPGKRSMAGSVEPAALSEAAWSDRDPSRDHTQPAKDLQSPPLGTLYKQVFGEHCEDAERVHSALAGAYVYRDWFEAAEQDIVLTKMQEAGWLLEGESDQVMLFGGFPDWATQLSQQLPTELLPDKGFFNQMTANRYCAGDKLKPHVDLLKFEDDIFILSFESEAVMTFEKAARQCDCLLAPGDLLLLQKEARYDWTHGISEITKQRTSLTFRRMKENAARP